MNAREFLKKYKSKHKCIICGESEPCCLEFHHLENKEFSLSHRLKHDVDQKDILREMNKCCLLCANCHRKAHNGILNIKNIDKNKVHVLITDFNQNI